VLVDGAGRLPAVELVLIVLGVVAALLGLVRLRRGSRQLSGG
jgi:hypothetical protein